MKLDTALAFAAALPQATQQPHHEMPSFRVRGKIFLTVPPDGADLHVFVAEAAREQALALHPSFTEKLLWGGKVVGLRIALAGAPPDAVKALIRAAWAHKAGAR